MPPAPPAPPRPPKKSSLKAKKALKRQRQSIGPSTEEPSSSSKPSRPTPRPRQSVKEEQTPFAATPHKKEDEPVSGTRRRTQVAFYGNPTPTAQALKRGANAVPTPSSSRSVRSTRAHPSEARSEQSNAVNTPVKGAAKGKGKAETPASLPRGTRVSRRLRETEDEWQQIPPEWLSNGTAAVKSSVNGKAARTTAADDDAESELSELTDEDEHEAKVKASGADSVQTSPVKPEPAKEDVEAMDVDEVRMRIISIDTG